jgi:hypothetical protein
MAEALEARQDAIAYSEAMRTSLMRITARQRGSRAV